MGPKVRGGGGRGPNPEKVGPEGWGVLATFRSEPLLPPSRPPEKRSILAPTPAQVYDN